MRGALATLAAAAALLGFASGASGNGSHHQQPRGLVPHAGLGLSRTHTLSKRAAHFTPLTFDANYESLINQYFTDVAAASVTHSTSNVYSTDPQYTDGSGAAQYNSTFGGSYVDNDPLPANGCDDGVDAVCLTDQQLQDEIQNVLTAKGWHGSNTNMFFLMTPNGVGSCIDGVSGQCSTNVYCAYHNAFTDLNGEPVIYANEPYEATLGGCDPGSSPNSDDADVTINTISHEHNEAITDPFGDAWYAADLNENGDLCAWGFGSALGNVGGQPYNQVINGHDYWLQQEYSNADHGCVQSFGGTSSPPTTGHGPLVYHPPGLVMHTNTTYAIYWLPTPGNTTPPSVTGAAAVNQTLMSSQGAWNGSPTGFAYQWQRCSSGGTSCVSIPGATASTYQLTSADGGSTVRSTVSATNVNGPSPYVASSPSPVVAPVPAATAAPLISGVAAVGKGLFATTGTWNTSASFAYQWERCAANGSACAAIPAATASSYPVVGADAGHRLKAVVSANNAAGSASASSATTAVVVAVPHTKRAPHISGKADLGRRLSASRGTWTWAPRTYRYQWLRCSASGRRCVSIGKATHVTYRLTTNDVGHRLRLRVTATNAAGSRIATSAGTARVAH